MENMVFTKQLLLSGRVKPQDLPQHGFLVLPFDALNTSFADLASVYLKPSISYTVYRQLARLDIQPVADRPNMLNVFTSDRYKQFLQMICRENYRENRDQHLTVDFSVLEGPHPVDVSSLPYVQNTKAGRRIFEQIEYSSYNVFNPEDIWVVRVITKYVELGVQRTLCEFNVYLPKGVCLV